METNLDRAPSDSARRTGSQFITRVVLKNYRSIAACDVELNELTFLVGPNGSGKSNFIDALRLTTEALQGPLEIALQNRDGIQEVRRRSARGGHPTHLGVRLHFRLPGGRDGIYRYEIGARAGGGFVVQVEECSLGDARYVVRAGVVESMTESVSPPAVDDRLYLAVAAALPPFKDVYDSLKRMGYYSIDPARIREPQKPDAGEILSRDGRNLASVLKRLAKAQNGLTGVKQRIEAYLSQVMPGLERVEIKSTGPHETLEFMQRVVSQASPLRFYPGNMSDGTLRALGNLVALFQSGRSSHVPLVAIEEPEVALHPAAAGVLLDALHEASDRIQVLVTSHSPELLDNENLEDRQILAVAATDGRTEIGPIDRAGREALSERLYTAGELLKLNQLRPEPGAFERAEQAQRNLFDPDPG